MDISNILQNWYNDNKRDLPWRNTKNPYFIWLSEVILQQTRVAQGLEYYKQFIVKYPDIKSLAKANEEDVLKLWQGLGYYSRARNLLTGAKQILTDFNGNIPESYSELLKIKGIGKYTAAAISSFAFNKNEAVVDGNVIRFISRHWGIIEDIKLNSTLHKINIIATKILDKKTPGIHNQAIMEFGALICRPKKPKCSECVFSNTCISNQKQLTEIIPYKSLGKIQKERYFNYLVLLLNDSIVINKRTNNDIWRNLYDFPLIEINKQFPLHKLKKSNEFQSIVAKKSYNIIESIIFKPHVLSHQIIYSTFIVIQLHEDIVLNGKYKLILINELNKYPVPVLINNFINKYPIQRFKKDE